MSPEDASRRDLAINAMSYDPLEEVLPDPAGGVGIWRLGFCSIFGCVWGGCFACASGDAVCGAFQFACGCGQWRSPGLDPLNLPKERLWDEWKKFILKGRILRGLAFL